MNRIWKILCGVACAFAFCFLAIGYAAVQDELLVTGSVSVNGYVPKYNFSAADVEGYTYDADTGVVTIQDIYYDSLANQNYRVMGIADNGFSSEAISNAKKKYDNDETLTATDVEGFVLPENLSQIGENAFTGLKNLKTFRVEDGNTAFVVVDDILYCSDMATLVRYPSMKNGNYYIVPATVKTILDGAFSENYNCTAIVTTLYHETAWGSPSAVMLNTTYLDDAIKNVTGNVTDGFTVFLEKTEVGLGIVLQGNDDPANDTYKEPKNVWVEEGQCITIEASFCQPCQHEHYAEIYLSSWQTLAYAYLTDDGRLEIHNCKTAIVGGMVYQWVKDDDSSHRALSNTKLYNLPAGVGEGSQPLPTEFDDWSGISSTVKTVEVIDAIEPTSLLGWFDQMSNCEEMYLANLNTSKVSNITNLLENCYALDVLNLGENFGTTSQTFGDLGIDKFITGWTKRSENDLTDYASTGISLGVEDTYTAVTYCYATYNTNDCILYFYQRKYVPQIGEDFYDGEQTHYIAGVYSWRAAQGSTPVTVTEGCRSPKNFDATTPTTYKSYGGVIDTGTVKAVQIVDSIAPNTLKYWFTGFNRCESFVGLEKIDTTKATSMEAMFYGCFNKTTTITELDLSTFNTSNITNMKEMFRACTNLKKIIVSEKFVVAQVTTSSNMFIGCTSLVGGNGTLFTDSYTGKTYARIDGANGQPGYFTAPTHEHFIDHYTVNADGTHTEYCSVYGEPIKTEAHGYTDGKCVCGAEETTTVAVEPTCICEIKCTEPTETCEVCKADITNCKGTAPTQPAETTESEASGDEQGEQPDAGEEQTTPPNNPPADEPSSDDGQSEQPTEDAETTTPSDVSDGDVVETEETDADGEQETTGGEETTVPTDATDPAILPSEDEEDGEETEQPQDTETDPQGQE